MSGTFRWRGRSLLCNGVRVAAVDKVDGGYTPAFHTITGRFGAATRVYRTVIDAQRAVERKFGIASL